MFVPIPGLGLTVERLTDALREPGYARVDFQDPWFTARESISGVVEVYEHHGVPVTMITHYDRDPRAHIVRPDLVPDIAGFLRTRGLPVEQVGYDLCPPNKVPAIFNAHKSKLHEQAIQCTDDFDSGLNGPNFRHLRQNLARSERQGVYFVESLPYCSDQISDLVFAWASTKGFVPDADGLGSFARRLKLGDRIANVMASPFGRLYGAVARDGELRAVVATIEMGDYANVECIASRLGPDRAQEYLETNLWKSLSGRGIGIVDRGNKRSQSTALLDYKQKFATIHTIPWLCAPPRF